MISIQLVRRNIYRRRQPLRLRKLVTFGTSRPNVEHVAESSDDDAVRNFNAPRYFNKSFGFEAPCATGNKGEREEVSSKLEVLLCLEPFVLVARPQGYSDGQFLVRHPDIDKTVYVPCP